MAPSSRVAASSKPNVAYRDLNFSALLKKQTTLPSLAYAGIPYQVFAQRSGAAASTIAWIRLAMVRSGSLIASIAASRSRSPAALSLLARSSAFSSLARAFMAARSSSVNPLCFVPLAVVRLVELFVLFVAVFFSGIADHLLDSDQVAGGIAEGAVADPVRLVGGLLDHLGVAGLQPLEGAVEVGGGEVDAGEGALGHHLRHGAALVVGDAGVGGRRIQDDGGAGLAGRSDRDPVHPAELDVAPDLEAEGVAVEGQGRFGVAVREERLEDRDVHGRHARCGSATLASRFLTGLVTCFATHGGIPAVSPAAWRR